MARALFINCGSEGHVNPTIGVVQELVARGEEVVYVCTEAFRERMESVGADVRTVDGQRFIQAFVSGGRDCALDRVNGLLLTADVVIPAVLEGIAGERFDYVIHDAMFGCGRMLGEILGLPAINSCTSFAQTEAEFGEMLERSMASVAAEVAQAAWARFEALVTRIREKYDVDAGSPYEVFCNPAPLTTVYTTKGFQPGGQAFGDGYAFVGPSIAARTAQADGVLKDIGNERPLYVSLGTVFNQATSFYKLCFEAFGDAAHTVVMAVGQRTRIADLGEIPANFIVRDYVPQTDVLQRAKLFVTHGGMNSVHEGLYYGVPLVVIPQGADQPLIARQVAGLGAGVQLDMQGLTAAQLREAVEHVLSDGAVREAVASCRAGLLSAGGARQAADEILAFLGRA